MSTDRDALGAHAAVSMLAGLTGAVLDRANTARRWRVNGELKAHEQL
jgi:hypothetical protein